MKSDLSNATQCSKVVSTSQPRMVIQVKYVAEAKSTLNSRTFAPLDAQRFALPVALPSAGKPRDRQSQSTIEKRCEEQGNDQVDLICGSWGCPCARPQHPRWRGLAVSLGSEATIQSAATLVTVGRCMAPTARADSVGYGNGVTLLACIATSDPGIRRYAAEPAGRAGNGGFHPRNAIRMNRAAIPAR